MAERPSRLFSSTALAGLGCALATPVRAELLTHHDLPYDVALTIAKGAVEACAAKG